MSHTTEQQKGRECAPGLIQNSRANYIPHLNHREAEVLRCLVICTHSREQLDKAAGVSNSPDVVMHLRRKEFLIACTRRRATDKHGKPCYPGDYTLSTAHIDAALDALRAFDAAERKRMEAVQ